MKESRNINLSFYKSGCGSTSCRISLPISWIRSLGFSKDDREAIVEYNDNMIIIRKKEKKDMEKLLERIEEILKLLSLKETHGNKRNTLKSRLNMLLTDYYNLGNNVEFLAVKYPIIKEINVYKTNEGKKQVVVVFEPNFKFKGE